MDMSRVKEQHGQAPQAPAPSTRQRATQDYARKAAMDDNVRQKERAENNREATRRQAESAFRESLEQERVRSRENMQAGVEKMVRSVVRKESAQHTGEPDRQDSQDQVDYYQDKVNSTYNGSSTEPPRDRQSQSQPSNHQQRQAVEHYQQSTRNSVDRTVDLVI